MTSGVRTNELFDVLKIMQQKGSKEKQIGIPAGNENKTFEDSRRKHNTHKTFASRLPRKKM